MILTTVLWEFEFSRTFLQGQIRKSAGKFILKLSDSQKMREIEIPYIFCAFEIFAAHCVCRCLDSFRRAKCIEVQNFASVMNFLLWCQSLFLFKKLMRRERELLKYSENFLADCNFDDFFCLALQFLTIEFLRLRDSFLLTCI